MHLIHNNFTKTICSLLVLFVSIVSMSTDSDAQMFECGKAGKYGYWYSYCEVRSVKPANSQDTVAIVRWRPNCPTCGPYGKVIESYVDNPGEFSKMMYHNCSKNYPGVPGKHFKTWCRVFKETEPIVDTDPLPPFTVPEIPWNGW